jgi:putative ABC transport system permease protein
MVQKMGWDQALGKKIQGGKVIGVVRDFHYASLHQSIEPFIIELFNRTPEGTDRDLMIFYMVVNVSGEGIFKTLQFLEDKFSEFDPKHPFEYEFLDDSLNKVYLNEQRLMGLTGTFSGICIFISCMGLFGLAAFTTEQRTKEIGIRKVLGATTWQIITMLAMNILLLVISGAVVASLVAYYSMDEWWLADFAYRISMNKNLWIFLVAASIAAAVAFITVALQSFRTAQANPINAIRYE